MKFRLQRNSLLKEISIAQEIISIKNAMSILSNVLLEVTDGFLKIRATDLKVSFETQIPITEFEEGITTVFCEKLLSILRSLPDKEVDFEQKDGKLTIKPVDMNIDFQLKSISSEKFPEFLIPEESSFFEISQKTILEMIEQTIFSVSDDETRYFMNGVFFERKEKTISMVSTDGRRLSYIEKEAQDNIPSFTGIIIPPKVLTLIKKLASGQGFLKLAVNEKQIFVQFDNQKISSFLIEGQFPNYSRVIPETQTNSFSLSKSEFIEALKRVSLLSEQKSKRIFLSVSKDNLMLNTEESEIGMAKETISCNFTGETTTMALNYVFLLDPLRVINSENISIEFSDPKRALSLRPEPKADYFHIVMPMQLD